MHDDKMGWGLKMVIVMYSGLPFYFQHESAILAVQDIPVIALQCCLLLYNLEQ